MCKFCLGVNIVYGCIESGSWAIMPLELMTKVIGNNTPRTNDRVHKE